MQISHFRKFIFLGLFLQGHVFDTFRLFVSVTFSFIFVLIVVVFIFIFFIRAVPFEIINGTLLQTYHLVHFGQVDGVKVIQCIFAITRFVNATINVQGIALYCDHTIVAL